MENQEQPIISSPHQPPVETLTINQSPIPNSSTPLKHKIVAILEILLGLYQIATPATLLLFVLPQLQTLYKNLDLSTNFLLTYLTLFIAILIGFLNIFLGVKIFTGMAKYFRYGILSLIITFFLSTALTAGAIITIITPIYSLTQNINTTPPLTTPTPTPNATANWKTYTNSKYGFSFKYPDTTIVIEESYPSGTTSYIPNGKQTVIKIDDAKLSVIYGPFGDLTPPVKTKSITIAGIKTNKSYITDTYGFIAIAKPNSGETPVGFSFYLPSESSKRDQVDNLFDQILSTFKFTQQQNAEGKFCGGIAANLPENQCPDGYSCKLDSNGPDASGICVKK